MPNEIENINYQEKNQKYNVLVVKTIGIILAILGLFSFFATLSSGLSIITSFFIILTGLFLFFLKKKGLYMMGVIVLMNTMVFFAHLTNGDLFFGPILFETILVISFVYILNKKELLD